MVRRYETSVRLPSSSMCERSPRWGTIGRRRVAWKEDREGVVRGIRREHDFCYVKEAKGIKCCRDVIDDDERIHWTWLLRRWVTFPTSFSAEWRGQMPYWKGLKTQREIMWRQCHIYLWFSKVCSEAQCLISKLLWTYSSPATHS